MKDKLDKDAVLRISRSLAKVRLDFPVDAFVGDACLGLEELELKQRVNHLMFILNKFLPTEFSAAAEILIKLKPYWVAEADQSDWSSFAAWPLVDYVGVYGIEHPELALDVLEQLTTLFSAEFAVRPFIEHHFELTHRRMLAWSQHENEHVRRLASEGCRPRLPWGKQIKILRLDPEPVFEILEQLKDDPSLYVRRSVANNLNDIAKDHANEVTTRCRTWSIDASKDRQWIIRHALRTLIKAGDSSAFDVLGYSSRPKVAVLDYQLNPQSISLGQDIEMTLSLQSKSSEQQSIMLDYRVHHVKANGKLTTKVFKWKVLSLKPFEQHDLIKKHSIRAITTRTYYAGVHYIEILINGQSFLKSQFDLTL